jgi:DNA polymerase-3 subunit alpha
MAGALDALEPNRALVRANVEGIMALANRQQANAAAGTTDLFGGASSGGPQLDMRTVKAWTPMEKLQEEFAAIGFFLSGHPLDEYQSLLPKLHALRYTEFEQRAERGATQGRLAGIVIAARERKSAKGNKFAFASFSDPSGQFEAIVFSDTLAAARDLLEPGTPVLVTVEAERDGETLKLRAQAIEALDKAASSIQRGLKLVLDRHFVQAKPDTIAELKAALRPGAARAGGEIRIAIDVDVAELRGHGRTIEFALPGKFDVTPSQRGVLTTLPGVMEVLEI